MQVKKFEAPTLAEALETIKRELGPEAIILQTKQNRRGFGLMSKGSVEVTAAVSERSKKKKEILENKLPESYSKTVNNLPTKKQADIYETYLENRLDTQAKKQKDKVQLSSAAKAPQNDNKNDARKMTAVRYADIDDDQNTVQKAEKENVPVIQAPKRVADNIEAFAYNRSSSESELVAEIENLKRLVEEIRRERSVQSFVDPDAPYMVTEALQSTFETLVHSGIERRFAVQTMRNSAMGLNADERADADIVLESVAQSLVRQIPVEEFFPEERKTGNTQIVAFVGLAGAGKTATLAKLATHATRTRNERCALIRIQLGSEEGTDPLVVFSKALHIPYRTVNNAEALQMAIQDLSKFDWIFVDTPPFSLRNKSVTTQLETLLHSDPRIRIQLVAEANTREMEIAELAKVGLKFRPETLIFTKLDEAMVYGGIVSLAERMKLPISVFGIGRKVTDDWENASSERIVANVLDI